MSRGSEKATAETLRRRRLVRQRSERGDATRHNAEKLPLSRVLGNQAHGELIQARLDVGRQDDPLFPEDGPMCRPAGDFALEEPMCRLPESPPREPTMYEGTPTGSRIESRLPAGETIEFNGVVLADDADFVRHQLEELVRENGKGAARQFARFFAASIAVWREEREREEIAPLQQKIAPLEEELDRELAREEEYQKVRGEVSGGVPWSSSMFQEQIEKLAPTRAAIAEIRAEIEAEFEFLENISRLLFKAARDIEKEIDLLFARFNAKSEVILNTLLDFSEQRVEDERARYGIDRRWEFIESGVDDRLKAIVHYSAWENVATAGLMGAARDLSQAKQPLLRAQKKRAELSSRRARLVKINVNRRMGAFPTIRDPAAFESLGSEIAAKTQEIESLRREFDRFRAGIETRYPALASFAEESGTGSLEKVSAGAVADVVGPVIYQRLNSINRVREALRLGSVDPWTLKEIVTLTMADLGIPPDTMYARVIRDEVDRRSETGVLDWILSAIALVLGIIAAVPTGGSSLAVAVSAAAALTSVGISGYMLAEHIQKYQLESSLATTDFDRARSISQSEPSAFWLALDIAFFIVDLEAAAQVFRRMAPHALRALGTGDEAAEALQAVENIAREVHEGPELAERVSHNLLALRRGGEDALEVVGAPGRHETEALAEANARLRGGASRNADNLLPPGLTEAPWAPPGRVHDLMFHLVKRKPGGKLVHAENGRELIYKDGLIRYRTKIDGTGEGLVCRPCNLQYYYLKNGRWQRRPNMTLPGEVRASRAVSYEEIKNRRPVEVDPSVPATRLGLDAEFLRKLGPYLDEGAVERLANRATLDQIQGQLAEEITYRIGVGEAASVKPVKGGTPVFLRGDQVSGPAPTGTTAGAKHAPLTDGMIVEFYTVRKRLKLFIHRIFETKSGGAAALPEQVELDYERIKELGFSISFLDEWLEFDPKNISMPPRSIIKTVVHGFAPAGVRHTVPEAVTRAYTPRSLPGITASDIRKAALMVHRTLFGAE